MVGIPRRGCTCLCQSTQCGALVGAEPRRTAVCHAHLRRRALQMDGFLLHRAPVNASLLQSAIHALCFRSLPAAAAAAAALGSAEGLPTTLHTARHAISTRRWRWLRTTCGTRCRWCVACCMFHVACLLHVAYCRLPMVCTTGYRLLQGPCRGTDPCVAGHAAAAHRI